MQRHPVFEFRLQDPNEMNGQSDWDIDFRQIDPGPMETRVLLRPHADITVIDITMSKSVHQMGCSPKGFVTFGLADASGLRSWNGHRPDGPNLLFFGSGRDYESVNHPHFSGLTISLAEDYLTGFCNRTGLPFPEDHLDAWALPDRDLSGSLRPLTRSVSAFLHHANGSGGDDTEDLASGFLLMASASDRFEDRSTSSMRSRCIRKAVDYIEGRAGDDGLRVSDLCAYTRVSWRTLDRAFKDAFGIGPKAYINRYRLGRVRHGLLNRAAGETIADIANAWGFWHMGQFAKDYHAMFGERPSQTERSPR